MKNKKKSETEILRELYTLEDICSKKANVYSHLLLETELAQEMEERVETHSATANRLALFGGIKQ